MISTGGRTVGIVGARGINNYGGYERMLADLVPRLIKKGYKVRCSCEKPANGKSSEDGGGATLDHFPLKPPSNYTLRKAFELFYDFFFVLKYALVCDVVYVLGIYGGVALLVPRLLGKEVIVNTDGLEWKRAKYHIIERSIIILYYTISLRLATIIIVDNKELKQFIGARHHSKIFYIPYGVSQPKLQPWDKTKLSSYLRENAANREITRNITKGKYWLVIARLEPENNIHVIVDGFVKAQSKYPLVVIGDFTSKQYRAQVSALASNGNSADIVFLGALHEDDLLWMLRQHCLAHIHGHSVGGTNPSLLEAMISKNLIVCHDNVFNREVCDRFAHYFINSVDLSDLVASIEKSAGEAPEFRGEVYKRAISAYSWDQVEVSYANVFDDGLAKTEETDAHVSLDSQN